METKRGILLNKTIHPWGREMSLLIYKHLFYDIFRLSNNRYKLMQGKKNTYIQHTFLALKGFHFYFQTIFRSRHLGKT